jgi:hypothetical protein
MKRRKAIEFKRPAIQIVQTVSNERKHRRKTTERGWLLSSVISLIVVAAALIASPAFAQTGNQFVVPPAPGRYTDLTALWWEWVLSIPANFGDSSPIINPDDFNPLFAPDDPQGKTTGNCELGQHGDVWFLAASNNPPMGGTRSCTLPAGREVLFPLVNAECSTAEGNGTTFDELSDCAKGFMDAVTVLEATIDGKAITNLPKFRFQSPLFMFVTPKDNPLNALDGFPTPPIPSGPSPSASDGFWLLFKPLSVGDHVITYHAKAPSLHFELSGTINIKVVPNKGL